MTVCHTVIFADLIGSTSLYEVLGNDRAAQAVQGLTNWIGTVCKEHEGRVVKFLGDGVLALFADATQAIAAACQIQRHHHLNIKRWPEPIRMQVKVGMAAGDVVEAPDGDCYGDAVNLAARLSDMAGGAEIWASQSVVQTMPANPAIRYRNLGTMVVRGFTQAQTVTRIEWNDDIQSNLMTIPGAIAAENAIKPTPPNSIELRWLDHAATFKASHMPLQIGRDPSAGFIVSDPRVSRHHLRLNWAQDHFVLTDLSSYGSWVRFAGSPGEVALRRTEVVLHGQGEVALGAPFTDFSTPTVSFQLLSATLSPARGRHGM